MATQNQQSVPRLSLAAVLAGTRYAAALLALLAGAIYAGTLAYQFVFDDFIWVVNNSAVRNLRGALSSFATGQVSNRVYRPLAVVSFALDYAAVGLRPWLYHLENVLLHAAVCVVLFLLFRRLAPKAALLAAALFAVLPVHTEAVANIAARTELLAALFGLLALLTIRRPLVAALFLLLALFSKESAIAIPALALLLDLSSRHRWDTDEEAANATLDFGPWTSDPVVRRVFAAFVAVVAVYLALYYHALGHFTWPRHPTLALGNPLAFADALTRLRTAVLILGQNLTLCFVPYHFSADYSAPQIVLVRSWFDPRFLAWGSVVASAAAAGILMWRRRPNFALGIFWFFIAIAPVANVFIPIGTIRGDRLLYLPSAGLCLVMAECIVWLLESQRTRLLAGALAAVLLLGNAAVAVSRHGVWRDMLTITAATVVDSPDSAKAHFDLGAERARTGDCRAAIPEFERALWLWPEFNQARLALGECWLNAGQLARALDAFRRALAREPDNTDLLFAIASTCGKTRDWNCATNAIERLMAIDAEVRGSASAWSDLGQAYELAGRRADAERARAEAARLAMPGARR